MTFITKEHAHMTFQVVEHESQLLQAETIAKEISRITDTIEDELDHIKSANATFMKEVVDLKSKKKA